jgi:DNA replication protein DnaC
MSISIYNSINHEFENRRRRNTEIAEERRNEIYSAIPEIKALDDKARFESLRLSRAILAGEAVSDTPAKLDEKLAAIRDQKQKLLAEAGYPEDYLSPVYSCSKCRDTGYIETPEGSVRCSCYRQLLISQLYGASNMKLLDKENFSTFNEKYYSNKVDQERYGITKSPRAHILVIKEKCLRFIENFRSSDEKSLYIFGNSGVGKTFLVNCIANELISQGVTVLYQSAPALFDKITSYRMKSMRDDELDDEVYKNIFNVELLIIDDLGTEPQSESRFAELLNILNTRAANDLKRPCKTIISTNIWPDKLIDLYTERVSSRVVGSFALHRIAGDDIRHVKMIYGLNMKE